MKQALGSANVGTANVHSFDTGDYEHLKPGKGQGGKKGQTLHFQNKGEIWDSKLSHWEVY